MQDLQYPENGGYKVILTTPSYPHGVSYPPTDHGHPQTYSREQAIELLRDMVKGGHTSEWGTDFGCYAEGPTERFHLCDIDDPHSHPCAARD